MCRTPLAAVDDKEAPGATVLQRMKTYHQCSSNSCLEVQNPSSMTLCEANFSKLRLHKRSFDISYIAL
jgi:hypothetical protein